MIITKRRCFFWIGAALMVPLFYGHGFGYDVTDKLSIGGVVSGAYQYQSVDDPAEVENAGRGALPIQPEFTFRATERDEIFAKFGFAAGNGLKEKSPFLLAPWAADLEDDVKDLNGRSRDYLLTAWYKHTFQLGGDGSLALTGGIIDSTDYLDENAYANDEFTQFMNEALVNAPNAFLQSYDIGGAVELEYGAFSLKVVGMNVGENDDGNNHNFYGVQLGYTLSTALGEGNYRVIGTFASKEFLDVAGETKESLRALVVSCDQELGEILGAWIRFGVQDDDAAVTYEKLYSGGLNVSGKLWGREQDNIGIGYAYLSGGNTGLDRTQVGEGYVRFGLNDYLGLTLSLQYMDDRYEEGAEDNAEGWIFGIRMTAEF